MPMSSQLQFLIAIDGRSLRGERTGVGTYTYNLLQHLPLLDPFLRILLIADGDLEAPSWTGAEGIQFLNIPSRSLNNFVWTNLSLARRLKKVPCDIFHSPGYTIPLWLHVPSAVTIHDVSYAVNPRWYSYKNSVARRAWYRLSARRASLILTPSEFSRREIMRVYGTPAHKIFVVSMGVEKRTFRNVKEAEPLQDLRRRYKLNGDFLLFVGDIHHRRNIKRIIQAFTVIKGLNDKDLELVLIGRILDDSISSQQVSNSPHGKSIRLLGYVPENDLALFYSLARAFVFPSFYEGFGLGVAEAMACGCPVIVSRGTVCEEVAGNAAVLVDPNDTQSIAEAMIGILKNRDLAAQKSEAGLIRSEQFSWRRTAEQTLLAYRHLARLQAIAGQL